MQLWTRSNLSAMKLAIESSFAAIVSRYGAKASMTTKKPERYRGSLRRACWRVIYCPVCRLTRQPVVAGKFVQRQAAGGVRIRRHTTWRHFKIGSGASAIAVRNTVKLNRRKATIKPQGARMLASGLVSLPLLAVLLLGGAMYAPFLLLAFAGGAAVRTGLLVGQFSPQLYYRKLS